MINHHAPTHLQSHSRQRPLPIQTELSREGPTGGSQGAEFEGPVSGGDGEGGHCVGRDFCGVLGVWVGDGEGGAVAVGDCESFAVEGDFGGGVGGKGCVGGGGGGGGAVGCAVGDGGELQAAVGGEVGDFVAG